MGIFSRIFKGGDGDGPDDEAKKAAKESEPSGELAFAGPQPPQQSSNNFSVSITTPPARENPVPPADEPPARSRAPLPRLPRRAAEAPPASPNIEAALASTAPAPAPAPATPPPPKAKDRNDATMVMSPPPPTPAATAPAPTRQPPPPTIPPNAPNPTPVAPARTSPPTQPPPAPPPPVVAAPLVTPPAHTPLPPAPMPRWSGSSRRPKNDTIQNAFDAAIDPTPATAGPAKSHGVSTAEDMAAVRTVFNDVAAVHVTQVRDVMLELRYGDADGAWIDSTRPALQSLRQMAGQLELTDLCAALDEFVAGVETSVANRGRLSDDEKSDLLRRYQKLIELIPAAFELDAERDRREPVIIEALLNQVPGVERRTIDKLFAVGLNRLNAFISASAEEVAVVSGIPQDLATAIVSQFTQYRVTAQAAVAARDPVAERRHLHDLLITMSLQNDDFVHASSKWSEEAVTKKREARRAREQTYQRIRVALARLGEKDQLAKLEPLSFKERIAMLDRYLSAPRQS